MRVALLSYNARAGDAIGNQIAEKLSFFLDGGADVRVFVESDQGLHPQIRPHCRLLAAEPRGEGWKFLRNCDLVVVDYSQAYALLGLLPLLAAERPRILFDYHGVTPPELWGSNAEALADGQRWRGLVGFADGALVHSRFARQELLTPTGFSPERTHQLGYPIDAAFWQPGPPTRDLRDRLGIGDARLILFVGRLAKNKRVPVLVELLDRLPGVHVAVIGDDTDVYGLEAAACRSLAAELDVADRLHILGQVTRTELRDAYRSADVFVMPSLHEGFCIPAIEAMACGLPVVAARTTALPETVAYAGLTFAPDDVDDLSRQVTRVFDGDPAAAAQDVNAKPQAVAIVAPRYCEELAGGAERSLRTIAQSLRSADIKVEIFTTCARREGQWANDVPEGTGLVGGIPVHRFFVAPPDVTEAPELRSPRLVQALRDRAPEFDRIVVGPYLFDLTREVARAFPDKVVLLPCFHDEPAARAPAIRDTFERVAAILYHSVEERRLAHAELGLNHPGAVMIGTHIDAAARGDAGRGRALVGTGKPYVVYCGRYIAEKGLPLLLEFARDYGTAHPDAFTFVFMGEGNVRIPHAPWAVDLGFVSDTAKRDVLAGATALIHPSDRESLSLVCLEAWAQGVPVLGSAGCEVFRGHLTRGGGGRTFHDAASFATRLDELRQHPQDAVELGQRGQEYARQHYGSAEAFRARLLAVLADGEPLAERMRRRGLDRAAEFSRPAWRAAFAGIVEETLDAPLRPVRHHVEVSARGDQRTVSIAMSSTLIPVRVANRGSHPVVAQGPARWVLRSFIGGDAERPWRVGGPEVPLPGLIPPGESVAAALPISVPAEPGVYRLSFRVHRAEGGDGAGEAPAPDALATTLELHVTAQACGADQTCAPMLDQTRLALSQAHGMQRLPDDYAEVCPGRLGGIKRWLKAKLLTRFKRAYVDVLSRQQSEFNGRVLTALQELSECCATLDHARSQEAPAPAAPADPGATPEVLRHLVRQLTDQLTETREAFARLQERVVQLESGRNKRRDVA